MGTLLSLLRCRGSSDQKATWDVFMDFENAQPTDEEKELWLRLQALLDKFASKLEALIMYESSTNEIREALNNPEDQVLQLQAWEKAKYSMEFLEEFGVLSDELESLVCRLLEDLSFDEKRFETQQALFRQFVVIIDYSLRFDIAKISQPALQNDFCYYRRVVQLRAGAQKFDESDVLKNLSPRVIEFTTRPAPMLSILTCAIFKYLNKQREDALESTMDGLRTMAEICRIMISNNEFRERYKKRDTVSMLMRVMVGVILLYDHVMPNGAFVKSSDVNIKACVRLLQESGGDESETLMNVLRYSSLHLNDDSTPPSIKQMIFAE